MGSGPLNQHGHFFTSTWDMKPSDMQDEFQKDNNRGHRYFVNLTGGIRKNKQ